VSEEREIVLEARQVTKRYPGTVALEEVDFAVRRGAVTALIGENGAGKSTLVKILGGIEQPTSGELRLRGTRIRLRSVREAQACGIGIIHQELNLCPNLTVAENIFLAHELRRRGPLLDVEEQLRRARLLMERLEQPIAATARVGDLPLGQQQIVEIAKALAREVRVLMMDEPTSALSAAEVGVLFRIIRDLTARGVAIVYISHRLDELLKVSDRVSVLRDGRMVAEAAAAEVDLRWIVERMTGRECAEAPPETQAPAGVELLRAESVSLFAESGRPVLRDVSFRLHAGEVLGIYGLMGAGRTELLECLMGLQPEARGALWLESKPLHGRDTAERMRMGLAMAPEDRQAAGLVESLSVRENMTLASLRRFARRHYLSIRRETAEARAMAADLRLKAPAIDAPIDSLSGGNQQKVVLARCLLTSPRVLLLDEPTRGVDVAAKAEICAIVRRLAASGIGILFVSSELEEVRSVADRILVLSRGAITGEFTRAGATGDALASAAAAPAP
jgi:erythritol transport system ATP-binding protein